jgi:hypothetical protein
MAIFVSVDLSLGLKHMIRYVLLQNMTILNSEKYITEHCPGNAVTNSVVPESKGSPHIREPTNGPYPKPGESTPHTHTPANLPKVHFDPILPSAPWSFKWSLSFGLSHQNPIPISPLAHACHMTQPPHSPQFHLPNNVW